MSETMMQILTLLCLLAYGLISYTEKKQLIAKLDQQEKQFNVERQQLLDRIQSSSFAEYKTAEIKVIKAQSGEKEPPKLEQL